MVGLSQSLIVGFVLGYSAGWLVSRINDRYTRWEEKICRLLVKRGKKNGL
jgi:NhaP-type Na+/H+ or K+/H+ antiporter